MTDARTVYAESALWSLPRLLSLLDRNPLSPTYGCFHRDYWLYKTSDFPDAVRQFGVHALALAYTHDFPGIKYPVSGIGDNERQHSNVAGQSPYYRNANVRDWAIAGLLYWAKIQHADGSFDEFYPYERGWVGPTAFTTYAAAASYQLLKTELKHTSEVCTRVEAAIRRAAHFIAAGESEEDHLANHHAMALLAVSTAADVLNDPTLSAAAPKLWRGFLRYQDPEGWSREYDGPDPGYLSATVSFLEKTSILLRHRAEPSNVILSDLPAIASAKAGAKDLSLTEPRRSFVGRAPRPPQDDTEKQMRSVLAKAVEFCSYFVYPDGSYAGTIGSRNTAHCYPHGFELLAPALPLAAAIAERIAQGLAEGKLVPPEIMSDRYVHYRVPEFLLAAIDARPRPPVLAQLPYERPPFVRVFPRAGITAAVHGSTYTVANLSKGGVLKSYHVRTGQPRLLDTGWLGELADGPLVTSQWIVSAHRLGNHTRPGAPVAPERASSEERAWFRAPQGEESDERVAVRNPRRGFRTAVSGATSTTAAPKSTPTGEHLQWIDPAPARSFGEPSPSDNRESATNIGSTSAAPKGDGAGLAWWSVTGTLQAVPPPRLFTLPKNLLFRAVLLLLGWYPPAAHRLKGRLRQILILGSQSVPCAFTRTIELADHQLTVTDELRNHGGLPFRRLLLGGDIPLRYVPQSRFFGAHELAVAPREIGARDLRSLNAGEPLRVERIIRTA